MKAALEAKQEETTAGQFLTFFIAGEEYAASILKVHEVIEYDTLTAVPNTPAWIRGVVNVRGSVLPVVDLGVKFGLPASMISRFSCIVITEVDSDGEKLTLGVLAIGQEGVYRITGAADIPRDMLQTFMLKGHSEHEGKMKVVREIREMVEFRRLNLGDGVYPVKETFDAIFCRNVLIYFDASSKTRVVDKLVRHLAPQGLLFIGHAENLHSITEGLKSVAPTVYLQSKEKHSLREQR